METNENGLFNQYVSLKKHIRDGDWDAANRFINSSPEAVTAKISIFGSTAVHIAIFEGHMNIVEELVKIMSEENLKIKDGDNFTVLGFSAIVANIQMAKCIIGKSRTLLSIGNGIDDLIPVVLALSYNPHGIEMARYLYSETPLEDLMPRNGINGAMFITRAIFSKAIGRTSDLTIFSYSFLCFETLGMIPSQLIVYVCNSIDMALYLLESFPELAIAPDCHGHSPVVVLANMSFAYRSGKSARLLETVDLQQYMHSTGS